MALFKKKNDPISDRARALTGEIADLEAQIKKLDQQLQQNHSHPRLRSTAMPHGTTVIRVSDLADNSSPAPNHEPIFEEMNQSRLKARPEAARAAEPPNELGVRQSDLPAMLRRLRGQFSGPSTTNPKLVSYLAAGGIQGLRPMRYEKRVARNRFIALVVIILVVLLGTLAVVKH